MNTTDAEIARQLDGLISDGTEIMKCEDAAGVYLEMTETIFAPSAFLALCRAVVERVGTSDPSVHQEGVNTSSDEAHGIIRGTT